MHKRISYLAVLCLPLLLAAAFSCSRLEEPAQQDVPESPETEVSRKTDTKVFYGLTPSSDATKTALDKQANMFWQTGDRIALFQSSTNEKYVFNGEDGSTWSEFVKDDSSVPGEAFSKNYALYPWAEEVASDTEGTITFSLPSTQPYAVKSFAQNANPMVAVTSSSASNELKFQNLCGFVQLRLYGDATVRRIRFYGNNNEVLCGDATVTATYGSEPALALSGDGKIITLDCGEGGITLGATAGTYTPVWLVIPPTTFTKGFTLEFERNNSVITTKSTDKSVSISRNHALPISAIKVEQAPKEITTFSLSDGVNSYEAFEIKDDIISVQVPNGIDMSSLVASFTFAGADVSVGGVPQTSGVDNQDFSNFLTPVEYVVTATDASARTYTVRMFNLPIVSVETPNHQPIVDKENWIGGTVITIREISKDGKLTITEYQSAQIKGRGNTTWVQEKKPYAIKLNKKAEVLGMPSHKRWILIANSYGFYFGNIFGYEMGRRTESLGWSSHAKYVELILNGEFKGCYMVVEQIKIDPNRLNIVEMSSSDIAGDAVTGGYLLEYDNSFDEYNRFWSESYHLPVMFKEPDEDPVNPDDPDIKDKTKEYHTLPDEQYNYVRDYINNFEASLQDKDRLAAREYQDYIDVDSFIDQYFVWEMAGHIENNNWSDFTRPRSVFFHKNRLGKLKAGPVWDFDSYFFYDKKLYHKDALYYGALFTEPSFVARVKEKWPRYYERIMVDRGGMIGYLDSLYTVVRPSALRDRNMWPWDLSRVGDVDAQYNLIHSNFESKADWLGAQIAAMKVNCDNKTGGNEDFDDQKDKGDDFNFGF